MITTCEVITQFLQQHIQQKPAVIGLSGGVDSSVVAFLLARALPRANIYAYILTSPFTHADDVLHAHQVADQLNIFVQELNIHPLIEAFQQSSDVFFQHHALVNLQPRIRMTLLYGKANAVNGLVIGTGNKTELQLGYFTKYGDGGVDLLPIGHLYKTAVWKLAKELEVPQAIIEKDPSAGLFHGQKDTNELQMSYQTADAILQAIEHHTSLEGFHSVDVQRIQELMEKSAHKLITPLIPTV